MKSLLVIIINAVVNVKIRDIMAMHIKLDRAELTVLFIMLLARNWMAE